MGCALQFCRYLKRTDAGDKQVVVVDGEIYERYLRHFKSDHGVNNVSNDGECSLAEITAEQREAIAPRSNRINLDLRLHRSMFPLLLILRCVQCVLCIPICRALRTLTVYNPDVKKWRDRDVCFSGISTTSPSQNFY